MSRKQGNPPTTHTVEDGDTFYELAKAYYNDGSESSWKKIQAANNNIATGSLSVGQKLTIPA